MGPIRLALLSVGAGLGNHQTDRVRHIATLVHPWVSGFLQEYENRPHEGLAFYTPADVFHGRVDVVHARRQAALDRHWLAHPARYAMGQPIAKRPPDIVSINPVTEGSVETLAVPESATMAYAYEAVTIPALANVT